MNARLEWIVSAPQQFGLGRPGTGVSSIREGYDRALGNIRASEELEEGTIGQFQFDVAADVLDRWAVYVQRGNRRWSHAGTAPGLMSSVEAKQWLRKNAQRWFRDPRFECMGIRGIGTKSITQMQHSEPQFFVCRKRVLQRRRGPYAARYSLSGTGGALGFVFWRKTMGSPKPASDARLVKLQQAINVILDKLGYFGIATDGILGPGTCGAIAMLGDVKHEGKISDADWAALVGIEETSTCAGFILPTKKGQRQPDKMTSNLDPAENALPWLTPDPRAAKVQGDLNVQLEALDYESIPVSGMLDAATCGAMQELDRVAGHNWQQAFGVQCQQFVAPKKRAAVATRCAEGLTLDPKTGLCFRATACPEGSILDPLTQQCKPIEPPAPGPVTPPSPPPAAKSGGLGAGGAIAAGLALLAVAGFAFSRGG